MRKILLTDAGTVLTASLALPGSLSAAAATATRAVAAQGQATALRIRVVRDAQVILWAWPPNSTLIRPKPGQAAPAKAAGSAVTNTSGRYYGGQLCAD